MIATAHQPAYLPWLGYFHKIALADSFVLLDEVQFEKNSYVNRNKIKTSNGPAWLTIPLEMRNHLSHTINQMVMDSKSNWTRKHWNSLLMNYKKTPFFTKHADFFEEYYLKNSESLLAPFIERSTNYLLKELNIAPQKEKLSETGITSKKQELIADICRYCKANAFVFGALGKQYADGEFFSQQGISIYFQEYAHPVYEQPWGEFAPFMSVVDALFILGADRTRELLFEKNITQKELRELVKC